MSRKFNQKVWCMRALSIWFLSDNIINLALLISFLNNLALSIAHQYIHIYIYGKNSHKNKNIQYLNSTKIGWLLHY